MKKGIIFDMDGTLWDSAENVVKAWNTIIEQPQYALKPLVAADMYRVMGMTMDALGCCEMAFLNRLMSSVQYHGRKSIPSDK